MRFRSQERLPRPLVDLAIAFAFYAAALVIAISLMYTPDHLRGSFLEYGMAGIGLLNGALGTLYLVRHMRRRSRASSGDHSGKTR